MAQTTAQRLADGVLRHHGTSLDAFITERREQDVSWERIARELSAATDGVVDVTSTTLRNWYGDQAAA